MNKDDQLIFESYAKKEVRTRNYLTRALAYLEKAVNTANIDSKGKLLEMYKMVDEIAKQLTPPTAPPTQNEQRL